LEDYKNSSQGELPGDFSPTVGDNPLGVSSVYHERGIALPTKLNFKPLTRNENEFQKLVHVLKIIENDFLALIYQIFRRIRPLIMAANLHFMIN
jgi:hypothetical protein